MAFTLILLVCSVFIGSSFGNHSNPATGFIAQIVHSTSLSSNFQTPNVTQYEWAKVALEQTKERINYHAEKWSRRGIVIPTRQSRYEYLISITIGDPEKTVNLIADTASSLTWIQGKSYDPSRSSSYKSVPCSSPECLAATDNMFDCDYNKNCEFEVRYGQGYTETQGEVGWEMFKFQSKLDSNEYNWVQLIFGSGTSSVGDTRKIDGIAGLDRNKMSLLSQLSVRKFSYCFPHDIYSENNYMRFGSYAKIMGRKTPILQIPGSDYFYLYLEGISVGSSRLDLPRGHFNVSKKGNGGFIIDSGTTLTLLEPDAFWELKKEVDQQSKLPIIDDHDHNFDVCFSGTEIDAEAMPYITFHFSGVNFTLPTSGAFRAVDQETFCLMFEEIKYGQTNVLGNMAQLDHNVGYDLDKGVVSFKPVDCSLGD